MSWVPSTSAYIVWSSANPDPGEARHSKGANPKGRRAARALPSRTDSRRGVPLPRYSSGMLTLTPSAVRTSAGVKVGMSRVRR